MYKINLDDCYTRQEYLDSGHKIVHNNDGTVSVYDSNLNPTILHENKACCTRLGYTFDINSQKCKWDVNAKRENKNRCPDEPSLLHVIGQPLETGVAVNPNGSPITQTCCESYNQFNYNEGTGEDFDLIFSDDSSFNPNDTIYEFFWFTGITVDGDFGDKQRCRIREVASIDDGDDVILPNCPTTPQLFFYNLNAEVEESVVNDDIDQKCCESYNTFNFTDVGIVFNGAPAYDAVNNNVYEFFWDKGSPVKGKFCQVRLRSDATTGDTADDVIITTGVTVTSGVTCTFEPMKVVVNTEGSSGSVFNFETNETCTLDISFDYLFEFDCYKVNLSLENDIEPENLESTNQARVAVSDKQVEVDRLRNLIYYEQNNPVPYVIECGSEKYCLTDEGLNEWKGILSEENYNIWLNSSGSDINTYGCDDVNKLVDNEPRNITWVERDCGFNIYDRLASDKRVEDYENRLTLAEGELTTLRDELNSTIITSQLTEDGSCPSHIDVFESLQVSFNLDIVNPTDNRLITIYEEELLNIGSGNLYSYLSGSTPNTGLVLNSDVEMTCRYLYGILRNELFSQYLLTTEVPPTPEEEQEFYNNVPSYFKSCWLQFNTQITDPSIIGLLNGREIKISFHIKNSCTDFSILLDRVKLNKSCEKVENIETYISEPPKFELERVIDNRKSWVSQETVDDRKFDLKYRPTEYEANHHKLVINTKELDLNLSPARAVEEDMWCYINDNNCIIESCSTDFEFVPFTCSSGFTLDVDGNSCTKLTISAATFSGTTYEISTPFAFNNGEHNLVRGTIFASTEVSDLVWPIYWTPTRLNTWVGPFYNANYLTDSSGTQIISTGFGDKKSPVDLPLYYSPEAFCGPLSEYGTSDAEYVNGELNPNILWGGTPGVKEGVVAGRLLNAGIWIKDVGIFDNFYPDTWVGFTECVELTESKVYNIGFAATEQIRIKVNGEYLINPEINEPFPITETSGFDNRTRKTRFTQAFVVLPIRLDAGKNIFEVEGLKTVERGSAGFVFEIYDATTKELMNMRTIPELESVMVFSTKDKIGDDFDTFGDDGYSCEAGFALDICASGSPQCIKIEREYRDGNQDTCCCEGFPLVVNSYGGQTIELPISQTLTPTLDCADIEALSLAGNQIVDLETTCGNIYAIGTGTTTSFDGFWITEENDGSIGVYVVDWVSGVTETYENNSDLIDEFCCETIQNAFNLDADTYSQGVNTFPSVSWDANLKRCGYNKCGDDGCTNIDTLLVTELSEIDSIQEFSRVLSSELIDVKNRQSISSYPTLRMLYERYNYHALDFCDVDSSRFDYFDMDKFGKTVGDYWVDLIEQVIPATTIWNSSYEYRNTLFDQQKYKYKNTSLFLCDDPSKNYPMSAVTDSNVGVITKTLLKEDGEVTDAPRECSGVFVFQGRPNEFLGTVSIIGNSGDDPKKESNKSINEDYYYDNP